MTMRHVPHLYLPRPWGEDLRVPDRLRGHLERVLRRHPGDPVTYTDGEGTIGWGVYDSGVVVRGREERTIRESASLTMAVAPPKPTERRRFLVEKLAELGVDRLVFLTTRHGGHRAPRLDKAESWAIGALEQSRGSRKLQLEGPASVSQRWNGATLVADREGHPFLDVVSPAEDTVVLVGPEGGFDPDEVPEYAVRVSLGDRVLRVETAAVVAAALAIGAATRLRGF